jgi:glycosyltransferase involved in cell wall biosynthesis
VSGNPSDFASRDGQEPALSADGATAVIPAFNEQERIAATVQAVFTIDHVDMVVVVDDGSTDGTVTAAKAAGAHVIKQPVNRGKAAAMERGGLEVANLERAASLDLRPLIFLDADLGNTASLAGVLLEAVLNGETDMAIANFPPQQSAGGGHGFVVRLARDGIEQATGWRPQQPLSGQRALSRAAFDAALPLAAGWGVEVGLTVDLLRQNFRVTEVPVELHHRVTGSDWRAKRHRAKQFWQTWRALRARGVGPVLPVPR